jgi:hypothetical protein
MDVRSLNRRRRYLFVPAGTTRRAPARRRPMAAADGRPAVANQRAAVPAHDNSGPGARPRCERRATRSSAAADHPRALGWRDDADSVVAAERDQRRTGADGCRCISSGSPSASTHRRYRAVTHCWRHPFMKHYSPIFMLDASSSSVTACGGSPLGQAPRFCRHKSTKSRLRRSARPATREFSSISARVSAGIGCA